LEVRARVSVPGKLDRTFLLELTPNFTGDALRQRLVAEFTSEFNWSSSQIKMVYNGRLINELDNVYRQFEHHQEVSLLLIVSNPLSENDPAVVVARYVVVLSGSVHKCDREI
jgi:hypothetical protein